MTKKYGDIQRTLKLLSPVEKIGLVAIEKFPFHIKEIRIDNCHELQVNFHKHVEDQGIRLSCIKHETPQWNCKACQAPLGFDGLLIESETRVRRDEVRQVQRSPNHCDREVLGSWEGDGRCLLRSLRQWTCSSFLPVTCLVMQL